MPAIRAKPFRMTVQYSPGRDALRKCVRRHRRLARYRSAAMKLRAATSLLLIAGVLAGCGSSKKTPASTSTSTASSTSTNAAPTLTSLAGAPAGTIGPEGIPIEGGALLASPATTAQGQPVDGVKCQAGEQVVYHIHTRLQVYVNGQPRALPPAIGMVKPAYEKTAHGFFFGALGCYYWLHVHAQDGVIHVESPSVRVYTLGNFFDEWRQPLSAEEIGSASGKQTIFVNGQRWTKSPRDIPLKSHEVVQVDVGSPVVPFHNVSWAGSGL